MEYIECPGTYQGKLPTLFIAGGIKDCRDWQSAFVKLLAPIEIAVLNPRRANFQVGQPKVLENQVDWEFRQLKQADAISFWFSPETLNPITLYELGFWMNSSKPIFMGTDPAYKRAADLAIQAKLARPELKVVQSLTALAWEVEKHFTQVK